jgi:AbrB family looped-hinge helix DNA binding protein
MTSAIDLATSLDRSGRIVLPSEVRRQLHLAPGARFRVRVVADRIELTPEPAAAPSLQRRGARLVIAAASAGGPAEPLDAAAVVRAERDALARRANRG